MTDPDILTHKGGAAGTGPVLLIACGALAREVLAINRANGADHFTLRCLPAILHNTPEKIPEVVRNSIQQGRADGFTRIFILYADCGTGGLLDAVCAAEGVDRIAGPHCYSFFDGNETFAARGDEEMRAFYLTDFLVRQFDAFVWEPLGLDRHPDLREMYFGHYERLIYLAQTHDPDLDRIAEHCAGRLDLSYERRFTGYGDLAESLTQISK
ncbi:hypothetical protein FHS89_002655 [Rubricella aquisinus]|uniref:DUF1638 domain-containing protein n=2 Tax=Rubricella aquisinus TaxID=2028108 RepID=A0A840X1I7_9RHOB|nr:DUF1638 domain-containing protein [Rubricella aquisinus]MBB5516624.1 hypothetical protein [Rubricella aquisinus]